MPTTDARGHAVPTSGETPSRAAWVLNPLLSVNDFIVVANTTERAAKVSTLTPTATRPILFLRRDAPAGRHFEYTSDGTTFYTLAGGNDVDWTAPTLTGSWVAFGSGLRDPGYRRWSGTVEGRGTVKSGGTGSGNPIFTFPTGYRPAADEAFLCMSNVGAADVRVTTTGAVFVASYIGGGNNGILSLTGIRFTPDGT